MILCTPELDSLELIIDGLLAWFFIDDSTRFPIAKQQFI